MPLAAFTSDGRHDDFGKPAPVASHGVAFSKWQESALPMDGLRWEEEHKWYSTSWEDDWLF